MELALIHVGTSVAGAYPKANAAKIPPTGCTIDHDNARPSVHGDVAHQSWAAGSHQMKKSCSQAERQKWEFQSGSQFKEQIQSLNQQICILFSFYENHYPWVGWVSPVSRINTLLGHFYPALSSFISSLTFWPLYQAGLWINKDSWRGRKNLKSFFRLVACISTLLNVLQPVE